jgi:hypothetical protein
MHKRQNFQSHGNYTDGIHVTETQNIHIQNCIIRTGIYKTKKKRKKKDYNIYNLEFSIKKKKDANSSLACHYSDINNEILCFIY